MLCNLLVSLFASIACLGVTAQGHSFYFEKLTSQNGLSNNKVNCFMQDGRGFMWIGTDDGLNRYDGQYFTVFKKQPAGQQGLSGNIVTDMLEDKQGVLWIATADGGITKYNYRQPPVQQFKQFRHRADDSSSIPDNGVTCLLMDGKGYIWLGTAGQDVVRFDPLTEKFEKPVPGGSKSILDLCMDKDGIIWVGRAGGSIMKINPDDFSYETDERYNNLYAKLPHATVTALYMDRNNTVWYGSWDEVLYQYNFSLAREIIYRSENSTHNFSDDEIRCFAEDGEGRLWMGGRNKGLQIFNKSRDKFLNIQYDPSIEGTISDNSINAIYTDHEGLIWLGTNRGINIYHPEQQLFEQHFLPVAGKKTGFKKGTIIYDFYRDEEGDLWIATSEGIYIRNTADSSFIFKPVYYKGQKLSVTKFFPDKDGSFYIGTNYSLFRYNRTTNQVSLLPNTEQDPVMNGIIESRVVSVIRDTIADHPVLLVSPYGHYLAYYDLTVQRWVSRTDTVKKIIQRFNLKDNLIRRFYKSSSGGIWLATGKLGIGEWIKAYWPRVNYLCNNPDDNTTIGNDNVFDITEESNGNLWVSTFGGGLFYFSIPAGKFTHITSSNNLLEGIETDKWGNVWMISNGDLHKYDVFRKYYTTFTLPDLEESGGIKGYIYKDDLGKMYAAGLSYFIEFDPLQIKTNTVQPKVLLTDFRVFNTSFSNRLFQKEIQLQYHQNYFTIEFAAPEFSAARDVRYSYTLEGWNEGWIETRRLNFVQFSNLKGGDYTFKVRATTQPGVWGTEYASIKIRIIPPFWTTWWFYSMVVVFMAGIIYAVYRYRINELVKRQAIRNKIARDLHDSVGSALSSISVYSQVAKIYNQKNNEKELQDTLEKIGGTSIEMISEMNDIVWAINPRNDSMEKIFQRMESFAKPLLQAKHISFRFDFDKSLLHVNLSMEKRKNFYLIFKESVSNALKYAGCMNLTTDIRLISHRVVCTVKDDGAGFDAEKIETLTARSLSGNGLNNMQRRAAEMDGNFHIKSEPGQGTVVELSFPLT